MAVRVRIGSVIAAIVIAGAWPLPAAAPPDEVLAYLRAEFGATDGDLRDLAQGKAIARSLATTDGREVAMFGAVRVEVPPDYYVTRLRDIADFKRHEAVRQIGTFGRPATRENIAALTLDDDLVDDLKDCEPHHCGIRLSREAIDRIRREVRWEAPDAPAQATRVYQSILADLARRYQEVGDPALMTYVDSRTPLSVAQEFDAMVSASPEILQRFAPLAQHTRRYPQAPARAAEDIFYWSKEKVGPKVVVSITHLVIWPVPGDGPVVYASTSKQLYGSRYFDSSLGMTLLLRGERPDATVLVYVNRSRVDELSGFFGPLKRVIVRSRAKSAMSDTLAHVRERMRARFDGER